MTLATDPRTNAGIVQALLPKLVAGYGIVGKPIPNMLPPSVPLPLLHGMIRLMEKHVVPMYLDGIALTDVDFSMVEESEHEITGLDGNKITLHVARPKEMSGPVTCVYYMHGGGMTVFSAKDYIYRLHRNMMARRGLVEVAVEFRNASGKLGNHPYPAALNDCLSGLQWTFNNLRALGGVKIVLAGESGGGNLALATAMKAKREGLVGMFQGVNAFCPFIAGPDHWTTSELQSLRECDGYVLQKDGFLLGARMYDPEGRHAKDPLTWPLLASREDLEGLPPTRIVVNELDPLRDEGLAFAQKLSEAGVAGSSKIVPGTFHGADIIPVPGAEEVYEKSLSDFVAWANAV